MKTRLVILFSLLAINLATAQKQAKIDSLHQVLKTAISVRERVDTYNTIAYQYRNKDSLKVAEYVKKAIQLAEQSNYPAGIADAYCRIASATRRKGNYAKAKELYEMARQVAKEATYYKGEAYAVNGMGMICYLQGSYPEALEYYQKAFKIRKEIGDTRGMSACLNNIGVIYERQNGNPQALAYHFKALKIREQTGDIDGMASSYDNIGIIHRTEENYAKALEYTFKALKIREETGNKGGIAHNYYGIGIVYERQGYYAKALEYFQKSLDIRDEIGDKNGLAMCYNNIGEVYIGLKKYSTAQKYLKRSSELSNEIGAKTVATFPLLNFGKIYTAQKQYNRAIPYLEKAVQAAQELGENSIVRDGAAQLALAYEGAGRFKDAYSAHKLFKVMADSLTNEENTKKLTLQAMQYEFDKKEAKAKVIQERKDIKQQRELQTQKYYTYASIGGVLALFAIAIIVYRGQQKQRKANKLLAQQKEEIALQAVELVNANEQLQELDKIKNRFFANISHELRTPLTLILGNLDQFKRNNQVQLPPELSSAKKHANLLHQLINQLLDITKLEAGKMELNRTNQPLIGLLSSCLQAFEALAYEKDIHLEFISNQEECYAMIDKQAFEKIVYNLLSNAYKFTPNEGNITLDATIFDTVLSLTVSDTGIGIAEKELPFIFDRFYQVDSSMQRNYEGTGIGLSLVKELVELHEGSIEVNSEVGTGTSFNLRIPIQVATQTQQEEAATIPESIMHHAMYEATSIQENQELIEDSTKPLVLIVEDHLDLQHLIAAELQGEYRILKANHGQEGFDVATEEIPDLIISDVMMPYKNGYELCEALKTDERTSHIPIILLTARTAQENKIQGLEVGADDYISKPFDAQELTIRVKNLIHNRALLREKFSSQQSISEQITHSIAQNTTEKSFFDKLLSLLEEHFADEQYDVSQMAEALNMSKRQLHRKLKAIADQSPSKMLQNYRLEKAKLLLSNKDLQVKEVGFMVGFASQSYFNASFKKHYGITPNAFRTSL